MEPSTVNAVTSLARSTEIVGDFYDSVVDAGAWQRALSRLCLACDGVLGMIAVADMAEQATRFLATHGDQRIIAPLVSPGAASIPFYSGIQRMEVDEPVTVDMLYDLQGPGTRSMWLDSPLNRDWAVPNGLDDFFWVTVLKEPLRSANLVVITPRGRAPITAAELGAFAEIAPHVRRAVTIAELIEQERQMTAAFRAVLDALAHPVVIVAADMTLLYANDSAEDLLREDAQLRLHNGALRITWQRANDAVSFAVQLGQRSEFELGPRGINVPLLQTARPMVAHVLPLARRDLSARIASRAAAAIFLAPSGATPLPSLDAIAALFGLTAAEKRVLGQVSSGLTRADIADANAVSDGTVKSQLASVYDKTGARDQRTLEAMVRDLTPPVRQN